MLVLDEESDPGHLLFSPILMPTTHPFYVSLLYNLEICSASNMQ